MQRRIGIPEDDSDSSGGEREEMELSDSESDEEGGRSRRLRSGHVCYYGVTASPICTCTCTI